MHALGHRSPEHDLELGEPEHEAVALIDEYDVDLGAELVRHPRRQLEAAEAGAKNQHSHAPRVKDHR